MRYLSLLATVLFVIAVPVLLVTVNIRYLVGDVAFYERGLRKYDAVEATGISLEELDRASAEIISYFEDDSAALRVIVVKDGQEISLFNARETGHMEDVKRLIRFMFRLNEISLGFVVIYVAALVLWSRERSLRRLAGETIAAIGVALAALISVGLFFVILGFDAAWDRTHEIVFPNDLWRLNPRTDHLIQMFPESFWEEATFIAGGLIVAEAALLVVLAVGYLAIARPSKRPPELAAEVPGGSPAGSGAAEAGGVEGAADVAQAPGAGEVVEAAAAPLLDAKLETKEEVAEDSDEATGPSERD